MAVQYFDWVRQKNLLTSVKLVVVASIILLLHRRSGFLTGFQLVCCLGYFVCVWVLLVNYRSKQHLPWVLGSEPGARRNTDHGLEPWEMSYPLKAKESWRLLYSLSEKPLVLSLVAVVVAVPLWMSHSVKVPEVVHETWSKVMRPETTDVNFSVAEGEAGVIKFEDIRDANSVFWVWNEMSYLTELEQIAELAESFPDTTFYAVRSYGQDLALAPSPAPGNVIFLNPRGLELSDLTPFVPSFETNVLFETPKVVIYDTEGDVLWLSASTDFRQMTSDFLSP